jgi:hypothetical protein
MPNEANAIQQAISRAVRDNLERIQRASEELNHAISDVVSACASNKPTNTLPPLLRAQASAASLAAGLEVLSRFVTSSMQHGIRRASDAAAPVTHGAHFDAQSTEETLLSPEPAPLEIVEPAAKEPSQSGQAPAFDLAHLSPEEQELHRRANRVAKVSMQDIKMLRPEQVRLGRQNHDLCIRLKDDIEKAHREYDRRFKPIMDHPVDYFYRWMVEILADGDAGALGEYPYATTAPRQ